MNISPINAAPSFKQVIRMKNNENARRNISKIEENPDEYGANPRVVSLPNTIYGRSASPYTYVVSDDDASRYYSAIGQKYAAFQTQMRLFENYRRDYPTNKCEEVETAMREFLENSKIRDI